MLKKYYYYAWTPFKQDIIDIAAYIKRQRWVVKYVYGPPRGGLQPAVYLAHLLDLKILTSLRQKHTPLYTIIIDDVSDSGFTLKKLVGKKKYKTVTMFIKEGTSFMPDVWARKLKKEFWIVYHWELKEAKSYFKNPHAGLRNPELKNKKY